VPSLAVTPGGPLSFGKVGNHRPTDRHATRADVIRLAANLAAHHPDDDSAWEVPLDPAGHPFRITSMPPGWPPPVQPSTED
jgi:hypothetical protein